MKRFLLPFLFLLTFPTGCPSNPTPPTPPTPVDATCASVCAKAATLGCDFSRPSPKGVSCTAVCENLKASGLPSWNLACMSSASTCAAMDNCQP
jgi:hypothetical protein